MRIDNFSKMAIFLFILSVLGLVLRAQGVSFGLPYLYHHDERVTVGVAVKFGLGDLNPHYFWHPNLLHYLLFFLYGIYFFIGKMLGIFTSVTDYKDLFFTNPTVFYLIGRVAGVIFGTATIPLLYLLGKRIYNKHVGLLAAFFLTFTFLHIRNSHYIRHDIPVTFFIVFAYSLIFRLFEAGRLKDYLLAGLVSGIAISTNWNAGILIFSIFASHILRHIKINKNIKKIFIKKELLLCLFMIFAGVFIGTPYLFLDFHSAIPDFMHLLSRGEIMGASKTAASNNGWVIYFTHYLKIGMGIPMLILAIFGFFYAAIKHKKEDLLLLTFPLIYYIFIGKPDSVFGEYIIPIVPFLCLFAARFLWSTISILNFGINTKNLLSMMISILIVFVPARDAVYHNYLLLQKDTRTLAKEWVERHIPSGTKIAMEYYLVINSWLPTLNETKEQNAEILSEIVKRDPSKGKTRAEILKLPNQSIKYTIIEIVDFPHLLKKYENYYAFNKLITDEVKYVILSSFWYDMLRGPLQIKFYKELETKATLVKVFKPFKDNQEPFVQDVASYTPFTNVTKLIRPGPVIKIYKLK